ncbi:LytTR family DNA-binding domain-containing protein [Roseivirga sp. E12]|uniref:LytR/AlgR family response regulator transcription factor n=1 Tax=Roseivirga sp. E12 TaxID=2819237 RepID=UPI001ABC8FBE|nr:LytTR family DNA-binding domain-containing protein [Roseivirga sp. E12]MBO3700861.1 response regulator transcription factor [Roseivirga sp. E12]
MEVLIIEDEQATSRQIVRHLESYGSKLQILQPLTSVSETIAWLSNNPEPDLIFSDVELGDGLCFEIFSELPLNVPIVFLTAYDRYMLKAFEVNSIDYILKPASEERMHQAVDKYFKRHVSSNYEFELHQLLKELKLKELNYKQRFLVKKGAKTVVIRIFEIAYFEKDEVVFLVTRNSGKFVVNHSLEELISILDPKLFFRVNRQCIVHVDCIKEMKPAINNLKIALEGFLNLEIIVSQRNVPAFRKWLEL